MVKNALDKTLLDNIVRKVVNKFYLHYYHADEDFEELEYDTDMYKIEILYTEENDNEDHK